MQQPVTMAHVFVREPEFFRSKEKSATAGRKMRANDGGPDLEPLNGMLQVAMADGGGADNQRAIRNRFGYGFIFFSAGQDGCGADGRTGALKCHIVGIYHPQMANSEVAHCPRGRADVEGIARVHQDDAQMIEFGRNRQAICILRQPSRQRFAAPFELLEICLAAADALQASCRSASPPGCANVKNLSNLCCDRENEPKGCKLQVLWATIGAIRQAVCQLRKMGPNRVRMALWVKPKHR